ncbi:hypothetical protein MiSe_24180 [Microseira wollei NIES-4236]|uniref:Uncharacterized protein n=1 Tax=Microseira wollei NIES-4236 TaxID=2530354 RepID=A0AAV3XB95_9CYAN|nr:hypothetical protein MiSe_24180 [Microseira wollei NIES-4236]
MPTAPTRERTPLPSKSINQIKLFEVFLQKSSKNKQCKNIIFFGLFGSKSDKFMAQDGG